MEITLEKIELVKDRTGVTYKEAKEALEAADGSVVDAIINIEESVDFKTADDKAASKELIDAIKSTLAKGHMSRLVVKKDGETLLNLPLTAGVVGAVLAPWGVIVAIIAAAGAKCTVEFVNDKGETTDINGKVKNHYDKAMEQGQKMYGKSQESIDKIKNTDLYAEFKARGEETIDRIKDSELYNDILSKSNDVANDIKTMREDFDSQKVRDRIEELKAKGEEKLDELKTMREDSIEDLMKKGESRLEELKAKGEEIFKKKEDEAFLFEFEDDNVEMTFGDEASDAAATDNVVDAVSAAIADVTGGSTTLEETVEDLAKDEVSTSEMDDLARILDEVEKENGLKDITD